MSISLILLLWACQAVSWLSIQSENGRLTVGDLLIALLWTFLAVAFLCYIGLQKVCDCEARVIWRRGP